MRKRKQKKKRRRRRGEEREENLEVFNFLKKSIYSYALLHGGFSFQKQKRGTFFSNSQKQRYFYFVKHREI